MYFSHLVRGRDAARISALNKSLLSYLALAGGVLCLSFSPVFVRFAQAPGLVTSFFRMSTAAILLAPLALRQSTKTGGFPGRKAALLGLLGGLFTSLDHGLWSTSLAHTSVANATLFNYIAPLWVALFAALVWREQLRLSFWSGLVLILGGMAFVVHSGMSAAFAFNPGDIFAIASSLFYAAYFLVAQRGREHLGTLVWVWMVAAGAALALLVYCLVLGLPLLGYPGSTYLVFVAAGIFSQIGGYFLVAYALGHLSASLVAPSMMAQPVLSALLAIPLSHEALSPGQILGGLAVLAGIAIVNRSKSQVSA
jgi:drug/metabolite transporter (DMT)-like permease